jgi:hypothetical protein
MAISLKTLLLFLAVVVVAVLIWNVVVNFQPRREARLDGGRAAGDQRNATPARTVQ